jgi:hypothetical protein
MEGSAIIEVCFYDARAGYYYDGTRNVTQLGVWA